MFFNITKFPVQEDGNLKSCVANKDSALMKEYWNNGHGKAL